MRQLSACIVVIAFLALCAAALAAEVKQIDGSVVFACPQGKAVKVKAGDTQVMLWVRPNCPRGPALSALIKTLKAGDNVTAKYTIAGQKNYLTHLAKR